MKNRVFAYILFLVALVACNPDAPYKLDTDTQIKIDIRQVSAGFMEAEFTPDRNAYYLVSTEKVRPGINPMEYSKQFMQLTLDSAYKEYIDWRYNLLQNGVPVHQIANFKDHALQYGSTQYFANYLDPNSDYWVYAFVVNPETNKPVSKLFLETIHTKERSEVPCRFRYRIKDTWDYIYPIDTITGNILSNFPYAAATIDSASLRKAVADWPEAMQYPANFFVDTLQRMLKIHDDNARILYGVYAHNNDGIGDGTSTTCFEEGVTYYTGMGGVDGGLVEGQNGIYKFTWHAGMDTVFEPKHTLGWDRW